MDVIQVLVDSARELSIPLFVFGGLLAYAIVRGQRALTSLILSLYLALLLAIKFPYYAYLYERVTILSQTTIEILVFAVFAALCTLLFEKVLSRLLEETAFEGIGKKVFLATLGTILIMAYSYHVLPITLFIDPGSQLAQFFGPEEYFFWWLALPLLGLFFIY